MEFPMRINKYVANKGWASRREADTLIDKGLILINGKKAVIGQKIEENDIVELAGKTKEKKYLAYYKGRGIITHSPSMGETDIATRMKKDYQITDVSPVGRLDKDSEGLIILSNDGRITKPMLDSSMNIPKVYDVTVDKNVTSILVNGVKNGVNIEGYVTKTASAVKNPKNARRLTITLTEGKKHQIRRMCAAIGYQVQDLKRVSILNIELGTLKPNQYRKIAGTELKEFLTKLGVTL
ncbi:MAG: 23S rRNA pseudouridine2604 synthase [Acidimicrobiales bacterium]|jgi:23S rRNA pseudouridine2604 synthase